jgi:hypothetical protein
VAGILNVFEKANIVGSGGAARVADLRLRTVWPVMCSSEGLPK